MAYKERLHWTFRPHFPKGYFFNFFRYWNSLWPSHLSFIFIRTHRGQFRLVFSDEIGWRDSLNLVHQTVPNPVQDSQNFGLFLRGWRQAQGLTLKDVGRRAGIKFQNLSMIENGRRNVGRKTREKVLKAIRDTEGGKFPASSSQIRMKSRMRPDWDLVMSQYPEYLSSEPTTEPKL